MTGQAPFGKCHDGIKLIPRLILPELFQRPFVHFALQQQFFAFDDFFVIVRQFHIFFQRSEPHLRCFFLQQPLQNRSVHLFPLRITCFF